ncbi:aminotransferase class IV family protein [Mycoplana sp. MJR14]|uniref:aminotransferase class IV family protein n=1 Tax=Mycoplana sp. MJR14 TaxID=3032583 RepID=UPI0023DA056E|nr:aminotransferase class IV family protein [Mycoplana sp. MJR14]MDF1633745.1 aminotransferase class IV family protein [Mycoplana sp. MJR14]
MDLSLIETLRWEPEAGFVRLERHLARLGHSAAALGLPGAEGAQAALTQAVKAAVANAASAPGNAATTLPSTAQPAPLRVRLELFGDGRIEVKTAPFAPLAADATWTVGIARTRLSSADPLLRHKTSRRTAYEAARAEFAAGAADEVLLLNERGEVCEGTITSVFVDDGTGILKTPTLACGLLAGVLREDLIASGRAREAMLQAGDLAAGRLFVGNSLRGLIAARLSP